MTLKLEMKTKNFTHILNFLVIYNLVLIIECNSDVNEVNYRPSVRQNAQQSSNNSEPNDIHIIGKRDARMGFSGLIPSSHPTVAPGSLADILVIDPNDPSQQPQPPLIFTSGNNPPEPVFGAIDHNDMEEDGDNIWSNNDHIVHFNRTESLPGAPQSHRQPPFFVKVEPKSASFTFRDKMPDKKDKKPDKPNKEADSMPVYEDQPLPPSSKPIDEKKICTVLGRGGNCFPFYPLQNVFNCFRSGGIVAMDIVRCSWVRACCVPNFF